MEKFFFGAKSFFAIHKQSGLVLTKKYKCFIIKKKKKRRNIFRIRNGSYMPLMFDLKL